mmetsp:Transcript_45008/g.109382  ORF Transcript_45008/g.109382 Transcript_45008/m.109382 type:complete len:163 (-) Transcript_45008:35-523(-)
MEGASSSSLRSSSLDRRRLLLFFLLLLVLPLPAVGSSLLEDDDVVEKKEVVLRSPPDTPSVDDDAICAIRGLLLLPLLARVVDLFAVMMVVFGTNVGATTNRNPPRTDGTKNADADACGENLASGSSAISIDSNNNGGSSSSSVFVVGIVTSGWSTINAALF